MATVGLLALGAARCGVDKQEMPSLTSPSEFSTSITLTASPDFLPRDGSSQSVITVDARGPEGRPLAGLRLTLLLDPPSITGLTAAEVVTDASGRATFGFVAPGPATVVPNDLVVISAFPIGGNFDNSIRRTVTIALTGASNSTLPIPAFTVTPVPSEVNQALTFDATGTTDEGAPCLDSCTYSWDFDNGETATGRIVVRTFTVPRTYNVLLSVRDAAGSVVNRRQPVSVVTPAAPTVALAVVPNPPVVNQLATFTATATAAANHAVQRYEWNFGDGNTRTTTANTTTYTYTAVGGGIYTATVRAVDDRGEAGSASLQLDLTTGVPTGINARFYFTPQNVFPNTDTFFNATESTPSNGATISQYVWDWGDGTFTTCPGGSGCSSTTPAIVTKRFTVAKAPGYQVQLTIVDSQGRISRNRQTVLVSPAVP